MTDLVEIKNLVVSYPIMGGLLGRKVGEIRAVNDVSFSIRRGEVLGLVGESGCGKSTLGKALIRLIEPASGEILFDGINLSNLESNELRIMRRRFQIIFQDPYSSLNPRMRIGNILSEPFIIHKLCPSNKVKDSVMELLKIVGLRPESFQKYPHEFSGGQRQRIGIARALAVRPEFIVADEPVSALDVSIQSQILNLLKQLQGEFSLTYLFVSHDLNVVRYLCDRIVVMYLGKVMEVLDRSQLRDPNFKMHPYTEALLSSAPRKHPDEKRDRIQLKGDIPSPANPPSGCVFNPRCREADRECTETIPPLREFRAKDHQLACLKRSEPANS